MSVFPVSCLSCLCFFFNHTAPTEIYPLSLHDALPISMARRSPGAPCFVVDRRRTGRARHVARYDRAFFGRRPRRPRSEEHTSELQSLRHLVCRLLLEKKKKKKKIKQENDINDTILNRK